MIRILRVLVDGFQDIDMDVVKRMYLALVLLTLLKETNLWSVAEKFQLSRGFIQALLNSSSAFCSCVLHFTEVRAFSFRADEIWHCQGWFQACWNERCFLCTRVQELEEFWPFRALLTELTRRLSYCVTAELIPLMEVAGVMEVSVELEKWELISIILSLHPDYSSIFRFDWTGLISLNFIEHIIFFLQSRAKQLYKAGYKTLSHLANADPAVLSKTIENLYKKQANQIVASARVGVTFTWVLPHDC